MESTVRHIATAHAGVLVTKTTKDGVEILTVQSTGGIADPEPREDIAVLTSEDVDALEKKFCTGLDTESNEVYSDSRRARNRA